MMFATLLTRRWKPLVMLLLVAFLFVGGWWCGAITTTKAWELKWFQRDAADAKAIARREQAEREGSQRRQRDVTALDAKYTKRLTDARLENDRLRDDVAIGRRQLRIKGTCSVSATTVSSCMGNGSAIGVSRETGSIVFDIRSGMISDQQKLRFLQEYVKTQCH